MLSCSCDLNTCMFDEARGPPRMLASTRNIIFASHGARLRRGVPSDTVIIPRLSAVLRHCVKAHMINQANNDVASPQEKREHKKLEQICEAKKRSQTKTS